jgi:hypothetical protein
LLDPHPGEAAFDQLLAEITAVPESELLQLNLDVLEVVTTVLGRLPMIRAMREEIDATFKRFDLARFDKLERYALALSHAHTLWRSSAQG